MSSLGKSLDSIPSTISKYTVNENNEIKSVVRLNLCTYPYSSTLKKETLVEAWSKPELSSSYSPKPPVTPGQLSWTTPSMDFQQPHFMGGGGCLTTQAFPVLWSRRQTAGTKLQDRLCCRPRPTELE